MIGFRGRLERAISGNSEYKNNVWKLSEDAGLGTKTVYNILNDDRLDTSKTGPGFFGISRVANLLGVSLDGLAGMSQHSISTPDNNLQTALSQHALETIASQMNDGSDNLSADFLLRIYAKSGGRIEAFSKYFDRCDQYLPPAMEDHYSRVKIVGTKSLSAITMGTPSQPLLQEALKNMGDKDLQARVIQDYRNAMQRGTLVTVETLDIQMPNHPVRVKMDFIRVLLAVKDAASNQTLLNFSLLVV